MSFVVERGDRWAVVDYAVLFEEVSAAVYAHNPADGRAVGRILYLRTIDRNRWPDGPESLKKEFSAMMGFVDDQFADRLAHALWAALEVAWAEKAALEEKPA